MFELKRKFIHIFGFLYILVYYFFMKNYSHNAGLLALTVILLFFISMEFFRVQLGKKIPIIHIFWRDKEKDKMGGYVFFVTGAIIAFAVFDFQIAIVSLLMIVFGDTASALFGIKFGKHWINGLNNRAWEGVIAEFVVDFIIAILILQNFWIAIGMALAATFAETVLEFIDDNLSIPLFSGFVGQLISMFLR